MLIYRLRKTTEVNHLEETRRENTPMIHSHHTWLIRYMGFYEHSFLCLVGCFSMIIWTPTVLSVLYACVLYLHLFSAIEHVSHGKAL